MRLYAEIHSLGYTTSGQTCEVLEAFEKYLDVNKISNFIREIDGNNKLGAGQLAEKIVEFLVRGM